jgi:2,3-bisphosphoglycerate-independent phosphoglycerate mutase
LDGRDTLYNSGFEFVGELNAAMRKLRTGFIASISGRFYAMDRDNRWDRTEKAYQAIALGESPHQFDDAEEAIKESYASEVYDEEFIPVVLKHKGDVGAPITEGDALIFTNFRADRARQMTNALAAPDFSGFERTLLKGVHIATMTEYENNLPVHVLYPEEEMKNTLSEVLSSAGLVQLHIAETEKYAHVTFFFNGAKEEAFPQEDRVIIPSPRVSSYDEKPAMSTPEISKRIVSEVQTGNYDAIIANFANPDMVAHTGNFAATVKAHESVDAALGEISQAVLAAGGVLLITADHGNSEEVANLQTGEMDKEHSTNPVPFLIISNELEGQPGLSGDVPNGDLALLPPIGMLADVAPTMLAILGIPQPQDMTGTPLIDLD